MEVFEAAEVLKGFWVEAAERVSSAQVVLATCPFCGKGDRIRLLPREGRAAAYQEAWETLARPGGRPGLCGFCLNVVLVGSGSRAQAPGLD